MQIRNLSFHPKLIAVFEVILGLIMLWWLKQLGAVAWVLGLWFFFRLLLWLALLRLVYYPATASRRRHFFSLVVFGAGSLLLLLFIDWEAAWYLVALSFIVFPAFSFWFLPVKEGELPFFAKQGKRFRFLLCLFGLTGIWVGLGAIISFQIYSLGLGWWLLICSLISAVLSGWWWKEYGVVKDKIFWPWMGASFLIMLELSWAIFLWPIGYLAMGMLLAWFWYLLWVIGRFHLSAEGLNWKKQVPFLIVNALLISIFLIFLVRWK